MGCSLKGIEKIIDDVSMASVRTFDVPNGVAPAAYRRPARGSPTLEDLAAEHGVSRERVRQIEQRAFQKVQAAMQTQGLAGGKQLELRR